MSMQKGHPTQHRAELNRAQSSGMALLVKLLVVGLRLTENAVDLGAADRADALGHATT